MSNYPHGRFCWVELTANDWQQAKDFYCQLFSWQAIDQDISGGMYYTMLQSDGKTVAAMYQMTDIQKMQKQQTSWLSYIAVDDVDASVVLATTLGAEVLAGPHDVMGAGRMAVINEANGAQFAIWQGKEHPGLELRDANNSLCWNELVSRDTSKSKEFYQHMFSWQYTDKDMAGMSYTELSNVGIAQGGMMQLTKEWGNIPPHWMSYFSVKSCDETVAKAQRLGAEICVPATDIPKVGRFSVINDPQGATFSVIELLET